MLVAIDLDRLRLAPERVFRGFRNPALRVASAVAISAFGWVLVAWIAAEALIVDPSTNQQADAILVLSNPSLMEERTAHAAELLRAGHASRILLTNENLISRWSESQQRNLYTFEWAKEELLRNGVREDQVVVLPQFVSGTYSEAMEAMHYAQSAGLKSIVVVTSAYHSRRARWTFERIFNDTGIHVYMDAARVGQQTPTALSWWTRPSGWNVVALEYPKLIYYWLRYGFKGSVEHGQQRLVSDSKLKVGFAQAGMTLALSAPETSYTDEVVLIDARSSAGVPNRPQRDSTPSLTIDYGDGFNCNLLACGHAYRAPGTYTITVSAKNKDGEVGAPVTATIKVSDVPSLGADSPHMIDMTVPKAGPLYIPQTAYGNAAANGTKLQNAVKKAASRNSVEQEIVLPAGAVFAGPIYLPTPVGNKYITIRSGSLGSLTDGYRVGPGSGSLMPVITAPSSTTAVLPAVGTTVPAPASPPHHYRLQGIHLRKDDESKRSTVLMNVGTDSGNGQTQISQLVHHFIIERCWFDGGASITSQVTNGLRIYGNYVSVLDSYLGEFRLIGTGVDTAAISLTYGQGPYAFWNNTMVATSENFCIAGGPAERNTGSVSNATTSSATLSAIKNLELDQNIAFKVGGTYGPDQTTIIRSISGNNVTFDPIPVAPDNGSTAEWIATPSYIEFRQNYLYKPLSWRPSDPSWNGQTYQIKNLFEAKFGRYLVMDGNVFQNQWISSQDYAITFTVRNQTGGESPAAVLREIQFSNNILRNAANGITILPSDTNGGTGNVSQRTSDITLRNNLFWNIGYNWDSTCCGHMLINLLSGLTANDRLRRIFVIHNTHDNGTPDNSSGMITDFGNTGGADESMWFNNVHQHGGYGFRSNFSAVDGDANIRRFLPPGGPTVWNGNLIVNIESSNYPPRFQGKYLAGPWPSMFVNYKDGDFTLRPGNPGKGAATDGTDIGVDMEAVRAATASTISGNGPKTVYPPSGASTAPLTRPRLVKPR